VLPFLHISWPYLADQFLRWLSPLNWILAFSPPECSVDVGYFFKWGFRVFLPFLIFGIVVLGSILVVIFLFGFRKIFKGYSGYRWVHILKTAESRTIFKSSASGYSILIVQLYIFFSQASLEYFSCAKYSDGLWRLYVDPSVVCFEGDWNKYLFAGVIGLFFYEVVIPIIMVFIFVKLKTLKSNITFRYRITLHC
jgi:hypothetical protein